MERFVQDLLHFLFVHPVFQAIDQDGTLAGFQFGPPSGLLLGLLDQEKGDDGGGDQEDGDNWFRSEKKGLSRIAVAFSCD